MSVIFALTCAATLFPPCPSPPQVQLYARSLLGQVELPPRSAMLADTEREAEWRRADLGYPDKYFHRCNSYQ
jgi:hypothetical protein